MNLLLRTLPLLLSLGLLPRLAAAPVVLQPFKASGIYDRGETAGWTVERTAPADAPAPPLAYVIKKNGFEVVQSGEVPAGEATARIETRSDEPAMLHLEIGPAGAADQPQRAAAAVAPLELQPVVPRPSDFKTFWAEKIAALQRVPAEPQLEPEASGVEGVDYATIRLTQLNGAHVYGQIAKPARDGRYPAMLILQWAGGPYPLQKAWVTERAAEGWLVLNVMPHDVPGDLPAEFYSALPQMIKSYNTIYDEDRDRNYFLQMYLGDYRAMDFLAEHPEWDGETLVVTGTSMGGQQSFAVAGLHPKVTHMIVHVAAGADSNGPRHGRAAGYPNWDASRPEVMETALYFDIVNFAPDIRAASLVSMGFIDDVCPPVGLWTAFNQIRGPKEVVPLVDAPHNHQATEEQQRPYLERSQAWFDALVRGEEPEVRASRI